MTHNLNTSFFDHLLFINRGIYITTYIACSLMYWVATIQNHEISTMISRRHRKIFLKGTLINFFSERQDPTYSGIKLLQNELISNAVSLQSNLGDGGIVPLFLVVSDTYYQQATSGTLNKPNDPNKPTPPTPPTANTIATTRRGNPSTTENISTVHEIIAHNYYIY